MEHALPGELPGRRILRVFSITGKSFRIGFISSRVMSALLFPVLFKKIPLLK